MATAKQTTTQADKLQKMRDDGLASIPVKVQAGLLNPEEFDLEFEDLQRKYGAESDRITEILVNFLNENFSRGGKYSWVVGFYLVGSPQTRGDGGWKVLQRSMLGENWNDMIQAEAGLHVFEGAICWAGRGMFERHIITVKTTKLVETQMHMHDVQLKSMLSAPESVAGEESHLDVKEENLQVPMVPIDDESGSDDQDGATVE